MTSGCDRGAKPLTVPSSDEADSSVSFTDRCFEVTERVTREKLAMQPELQAALEANDTATLERLNKSITAQSHEVVEACGQ